MMENICVMVHCVIQFNYLCILLLKHELGVGEDYLCEFMILFICTVKYSFKCDMWMLWHNCIDCV